MHNTDMLKDVLFMHEALALAKNGTGMVSPNPLVGAVIVKDDRVIARGYHKQYGAAHAELDAIQQAQESLEGATLYCNLEPCCHTNKQTAPCAQRIIAEKFARVVISHTDPNPLVSGKGIELMKQAGIDVHVGTVQQQAEELNSIFITNMIKQRPFIHLKWAQSIDGKIATSTGMSKWLSNSKALTLTHRLRHTYDAVMVGQHTLLNDNPTLTARAEGYLKIPWRIALTSLAHINLKLNLIQQPEKTMLVTTHDDYEQHRDTANLLHDYGIQILRTESDSHGFIVIDQMLQELKKFTISSILVEGGSALLTSFYKENLWDAISVFIAPLFIGTGIDALGNLSITELNQAERRSDIRFEQLDEVMHCLIKNNRKG